MYWRQGKYADAEALYKRVLVIREKVLGKDHSGVADYLHNLGVIFYDQGKYAEAEGLFNRALAIYEKSRNTKQPPYANELASLADVAAWGRTRPPDVIAWPVRAFFLH